MNALYAIFAMKSKPDDTINRIVELEKQTKQIGDRLDQGEFDSLAKRVAALEDKVNKNHENRIKVLEDEIKALKDSMAGMGTGSSEGVDTAQIMMQINMLKIDITKKIDIIVCENNLQSQDSSLRDAIHAMAKQMESNHNKHNSDYDQLRAEFEHHKNKDFAALMARVAELEKKHGQLQSIVNNWKMPEVTGGNNMDSAALKALTDRVAALEAALDALRAEFAHWMKMMQDSLNDKADKAQLAELENQLMMRINDIVAAFTKQFADKAETKKALKLLERQLKNLYDLFMSKGQNPTDEDAMFNKKHLCGYSCASCEKDLVNLYGKKVEFMPWSKLPFRDPSERIARVGQGFSKMLSMINPDQLSTYNRGMSQEPTANTQQNFYPNQGNDNGGDFGDSRMPTTMHNGRQSV